MSVDENSAQKLHLKIKYKQARIRALKPKNLKCLLFTALFMNSLLLQLLSMVLIRIISVFIFTLVELIVLQAEKYNLFRGLINHFIILIPDSDNLFFI